MNLFKSFVFLFLLNVFNLISTSELKRQKRGIQVGNLFHRLLEEILGDNANKTFNSTHLSSLFSTWSSPTATASAAKTPLTPTGRGTTTTTQSPDTTTQQNVTVSTETGTLPASFFQTIFLDLRCNAEYTFSELCGNELSTDLASLDIWEIYKQLFSNEVLGALKRYCYSGHWCLYDEFSYYNGLMMQKAEMVRNGPIFRAVCQSLSCFDTLLQNVTGCPIQERMNFTVEALKLLCSLEEADQNLDDICYSHILAAFHVTIVEYLRDEDNKNLRTESPEGVCKSPVLFMTKSLLCLEKKCPNHNELFEGFSPWRWFTSKLNSYKSTCSLSSDTCDENAQFGNKGTSSIKTVTTQYPIVPSSSAQPSPVMANSQTADDNENVSSFPAKMTMILGVSAGGVIAVSGLFVLLYACWRKHGSMKRADKVGYQPLRNRE